MTGSIAALKRPPLSMTRLALMGLARDSVVGYDFLRVGVAAGGDDRRQSACKGERSPALAVYS